jgi:hypothetical protein
MQLRRLDSMIAKAVWLADIPAPTATTAITLVDATARVNEGISEMHRLIVRAAADTAYRKEQVYSTSIGVSDYALPGDFYQLKQVQQNVNGSDWVNLTLFTNAEEAWLLSATPGWDGEPFKYKILGKKATDGTDLGWIRILPVPAQSLQFRLVYIFGPPTLVNPSDQIDGFAGYEEYAIAYAAAEFAHKIEEYEKEDRARAEMARLARELLADARTRDALSPPRVQATRNQWQARGLRRTRGF